MMKVVLATTDFASGTFFRTYDALLVALHEDLEAMERDFDTTAAETAKDTRAAIADIAKINRMVRLISLNASVEAARSGDAGLGFAVIATEMKNLAERINGASQEAERCLSKLEGMVLLDTATVVNDSKMQIAMASKSAS